jgi:GNAT superfamily N-acetyltransferase
LEDGLLVTRAEERPGQRGFPRPVKPLLMVTMGRGVVVSCHSDRVAWLQKTLGPRERDEIFWAPTIAQVAGCVARDGQDLHGPAMKYICTPESFRPAAVPSEIAISVLTGAAVSGLYQYAGFGYALSYRLDNPRPDVVAAVARQAGIVVGIAAASADCETLWQIDVDIVPAARGAGIGRALVGHLTEAVFRHERVPYYSAAASNVRSNALVTSLGYWPAWSELYAQDHPFTVMK